MSFSLRSWLLPVFLGSALLTSAASGPSGTLTFTTSDGAWANGTVRDGEGGSAGISDFDFVITSQDGSAWDLVDDVISPLAFPESITLKSDDPADNFSLESLRIVDTAGGNVGVTITGYDNGATRGSIELAFSEGVAQFTLPLDGTAAYFNDIDEVRLTPAGGSFDWWIGINDITIAPPVDVAPPTITGVTSSTGPGSYKTDASVNVTVQFSEVVHVSGSPTLALNTGGTATYTGGTGTAALTFTYTVASGHTTSDLDYNATTALILSEGGSITDGPGNEANLTLPAVGGPGSLGANAAIVIDTTAPTISNVTSTALNGTYKVGDTLPITVTFSEAVTVTGTPTLALNSAGTASYDSGSGTASLTFTYTIGANDVSADLDYAATSSLQLAGGTLADAAANSATLTLPAPGAAGSLGANQAIVVDGIAPAVDAAALPSNGTYILGQTLDFSVSYSETVFVNTAGGTPYLGLTLDTGGAVAASYVGGSGTATLVFRFTVASGQLDLNGIAVASDLTLNGGTLKDAAGNAAATTGLTFGSATAVRVEGVAPTVLSITRDDPSPTNGTNVTYTVTFTEGVSGVSADDFTLTSTGTASGTIASVAVDTAAAYTVTVNALSGDGTLRLDLNGVGTGITDTAGNGLTGGYTSGQVYTLDSTAPSAPTIASVSTDAGPSNSDRISNDPTPTFSGTAEAGSTVEVFRGATSLGSTTATGEGQWSLTVPEQADGTHTFTATARDSTGNTSAASSDFSYVLDTATPTASSLVRQDPADATVSATAVTFRLAFVEAVAGVDTTDFTLTTTGISGTVASVATAGDAKTYDIVVNSLTGAGTLRLDLNGADTGITDLAGNALSGGFTTGETYTLDTTAQFPIVENFDGKTNPDLTNGHWLLDGSATATASLLRLTEAVNDQAGSIIYDRAFSASFGVNVQFEYSMGGYTGSEGADGLSFFLLDGATSHPAPGGVGHALGYAYNVSVPGATQGFMGVAFDLFGNFASSDPGLFHDGAGPGRHVNSIALRGPATIVGSNQEHDEYDYVVGSRTSYAVEGSHRVNLTVLPDGTITLRISPDGGTTWQTIYHGFDFASTTAYAGYATPATFKLGFAASTGGANNEHTIDNLVIRKPLDLAVAVTAAPSGTQKVGNAVSYTITVTNHGPNDDPAVEFTTTVPAAITGVTWTSAITGTGSGKSSGTGNAIASTLNLPTGATATFTLQGTLAADAVGQTLTTVAQATPSAPFGDTSPENDTASTATVVYATPVVTSALTAAGTYGSPFTYTITASNEPTSFSATGLPAGLTLNASTGAITGTPTLAGTFPVALSGTNSGGTGSAASLELTVATVPVIVTANNATRAYGAANPAFTLAYTGLVHGDTAAAFATAPTATTSAGPLTDVGSYAITPAGGVSPNYTFTYVNGTLTVTPAAQTINFVPVGTVRPGDSVTLSATASSGLPVTFTLVSGDATLSGSNLTINGSGSVVVRATQAGNANIQSKSVEQTITATKLTQSITFAPLEAKRADDAAFPLSATASSGLPVSFTVTSGPAMLSGNTLTLTGTPGTVTITATQAGNATYLAADPVVRSFEVGAAGPLVFFGSLGSERIAANVSPDGRSGTLIGMIPGLGEGFVVSFTINPDGSWTATVSTYSPTTNAGALDARSGEGRLFRRMATSKTAGDRSGLATTTRTFRGTVVDGVLSGTIDGLDLSFSANLQPPTGRTAAMAGYYQAPSINSATGAAYSVVGTQGDVYVLVITAATVTGSAGEVSADGTFSLETAQQVTIVGNVDAPSTSVTGTIVLPDGEAEDFSGVRETTLRTDRLINLSTRARITGDRDGALITGFVVGGTAPKQVLLRGIGPSLEAFGVTNALADPRLLVFDASGELIATNDDWAGATELKATMSRVGAFALPDDSRDAALLLTLSPGAYTMHVVDSGDTGVALAEIYDASPNPSGEYQRLVNISSRGIVAGGNGVLIGGFIVTGNAPKRVLVRASGPGLAGFGLSGVLTDPRLAVFDRDGALIARNDNWETPEVVLATQTAATAAEITAAHAAAGAFAFASGSRDAALIVTLAPGTYTAHVTGGGASSGHALIEVYELAD